MNREELLLQVSELVMQYENEHNTILGAVLTFETDDVLNDDEYEFNGEKFELLHKHVTFRKRYKDND